MTSPSHSGEGVPIAIGRGGEAGKYQIINFYVDGYGLGE